MKGFLAFVLISVMLVLLGDRLVPQRQLNGPTFDLTISGDTVQYTKMIEEGVGTALRPYKYRILVPLIGRALPFSPTLALKVIAYFSLFVAYLFALLTCRRLGIGLLPSFFGLFALYTSVWHLYNYHNPFLTDAFQLMILSVMFYALVSRAFLAFLTCAVLGILARESTLFLIPSWIANKQWRNLLLVLASAGVAWYVPRMLLSSDLNAFGYSVAAFSTIDPLDKFGAFLRPVFVHWGLTGIVAIIGMVLVPINRFRLIFLSFVLLTIGALTSSLVAIDIGRMFGLLFPVMIVSSAYLFAVLWKHNHYLTLLLVLTLPGQLFWTPTNISPADSFFYDTIYPRLILAVIQLAVIVVVARSIQPEIDRGLKEKLKLIRDSISSRAGKLMALAHS